MNADRFLRILEDGDHLPEKAVASLRAQLGDKSQKMSGKAIAKILVDKRLLTKSQARAILVDGADMTDVIPVEDRRDAADDDDLGFAALDDDPVPMVRKTKSSHKAGSSNDAPSEPEQRIELESIQEAKTTSDSFDEIGIASPASEAPPIPGSTPAPPIADLTDAESDRAKSRRSRPARLGDRSRGKSRSKGRSRNKQKNEFDSPLILLGGGALVLLLLVGALVWYLVNRDTGDALLTAANEQYAEGSYTLAIDSYERFVEDFPAHARISDARVQLAVAKIRKSTEDATDFTKSLEVAQTEIRGVEDEDAFSNAQGEIAALLERILQGLSRRTVEATDSEEVAASVAATEEALVLVGNTKYVPSSLRPDETIDDVKRSLELVARRDARSKTRDDAIKQIAEATVQGDIESAYGVYGALLSGNPDFANDPLIQQAVQSITEAEIAHTKFVASAVEPSKEVNAPSAVVATLTFAHRDGPATANLPPQPAYFRIDGAIYAMNAESGELLWRRFVGVDHTNEPVSLGDDVLVFDAARQDLLRISGVSGIPIWRLHVGESARTPVVWNDAKVLLATSPSGDKAAGKLWVIDAATGASSGFVDFAQPIPVPPIVDAKNQRVYVVGEHSSMYLLEGNALECTGVLHLGHLASSIATRPVFGLGRIIIAENFGQNTSRLRVVTLAEDGSLKTSGEAKRLDGHVTTDMVVGDDKLIVVTDRGAIRAFDMTSADGALGDVASRAPDGKTYDRFGYLADGKFWVAGDQMERYAIVTTGGRMQLEVTPQQLVGDTFDGSLQVVGGRLLNVRRRKNALGATIAAVAIASGETIWETHVAAPCAGSPIVFQDKKEIAVANQNGDAYLLNEKSIRARVASEPVSIAESAGRITLKSGLHVAPNIAVFAGEAATGGSGVVLLDSPGGEPKAKWLALEDKALKDEVTLATSPVASGDAIICPLVGGQIWLQDIATGETIAEFQPKTELTEPVVWVEPSVSADGRRFTIADRAGVLSVLSLPENAATAMTIIAESNPTPSRIITRTAIAGDSVAVGTEDGWLRIFNRKDLSEKNGIDVNGAIVWGPYAVADRFVVALRDGTLHCIPSSNEPPWTEKIAAEAPVGAPLVGGDAMTLAFPSGDIVRVAFSDGKEQSRINVDQTISAGPTPFGKYLLVPAVDGSVLVVEGPESNP